MKKIETKGIHYIEKLNGSDEWYFGNDYATGDLYEYEEAFLQGAAPQSNRVILIKYPEGNLYEPIVLEDGQYMNSPIFFENHIYFLCVDFVRKMIQIVAYYPEKDKSSVEVELPLSDVRDCYSLMLQTKPLMMVQMSSDTFSIHWPVKKTIKIGNTEAFMYRDNDKLFFSRWFEDPDYREEIVIRELDSGEIISVEAGAIFQMPDGQKWHLQ